MSGWQAPPQVALRVDSERPEQAVVHAHRLDQGNGIIDGQDVSTRQLAQILGDHRLGGLPCCALEVLLEERPCVVSVFRAECCGVKARDGGADAGNQVGNVLNLQVNIRALA
jgi:hypothetical protein